MTRNKNQLYGLKKRRDIKEKNKVRGDVEQLSMEMKFESAIQLYHWEGLKEEEMADYLIVVFNFNNPIKVKDFKNILRERLNDIL